MDHRTDPASQLDAVRRAEVLAHTRYPVLGWWYPPAAGAMAAAFVAAYALPQWPRLLLLFLWVAVIGAGVRWYTERRGVEPRWATTPAGIRRVTIACLASYALLAAAIFATFVLVAWWAASLLALVGFTAGIAVYEPLYRRAARQAEAEAGITGADLPA